MTYLTPHLTFASPGSSSSRSPLPPPGTTLLVSDTLASPADFVLLHFVAVQLKAGRAVILVGLAESLAHWKALARKIGCPLDTYLTSTRLVFVDALTHLASSLPLPESSPLPPNTCPPLFTQDPPSLRPLFDVLAPLLPKRLADQTDPTSPLVILDDISLLSDLGLPDLEITRFLRALQHRSHSTSSPSSSFSLYLGLHTPSSLLHVLADLASLHIAVRPLASGHSGAVSGEISFFPGPLTPAEDNGEEGGVARRTREGEELQYRLGDSGVTFFAKGTGEGFL